MVKLTYRPVRSLALGLAEAIKAFGLVAPLTMELGDLHSATLRTGDVPRSDFVEGTFLAHVLLQIVETVFREGSRILDLVLTIWSAIENCL